MDIHQMTKLLAFRIQASGWLPSVIVGVSRGGMLPATLLSNNWRLPVKAFNLSLRDNTLWEPDQADWLLDWVNEGKRILVVDDINDSGATVNWIRCNWQHKIRNTPLHNHVRFGVLLNKQQSTEQVEYFAKEVAHSQSHVWWVFPWENLE